MLQLIFKTLFISEVKSSPKFPDSLEYIKTAIICKLYLKY